MKLFIIISSLTVFQSFNTKFKVQINLKGSPALASLIVKWFLGMGLVSGQREVKVGIDVVHIRGEIYKHEVEKLRWEGE
jgi:hypothetical protein